MEGLIGLLVLAILAVPVLLVVALMSIAGLKRRVAGLEDEVAQLRRRPAFAATQPASPAQPTRGEWTQQPAHSSATSAPTPAPESAATPIDTPAHVASATPPSPAVARESVAPDAPDAPMPRPTVAVPPPAVSAPVRPDIITLGIRAVKRWFSVGNVPVKIGMLVLLAGVAALLKYAADQGWMAMPPELKLAGVAAAALAGLVFAWRKRESNRVFALSLQGGAIGVLLLVVFAAFKNVGVLSPVAAFSLSVLLVAGAGALAVLQDARALAVFALLAGFLAPIWLSTGSGSHVALFSYYALVNAAIVGIAWYRAWRVLNLLGFAFTFGIGTVWGVMDYAPHKYASTQPFLLLFFLFYLAIPLLFVRRRPPGRRDFIDGCLLFGVPLVAFSLQAGLMAGRPMALAFCALGLGVLYATLAYWLRQRRGYDLLLQAYAMLAVGFATLAVPLALSAQATASVFALEGAALVWLGLRQQRRLPQFAGAALQLVAAGAFAIAQAKGVETGAMVLNGSFMSALLIALGGFATARAYRDADNRMLALVAYGWGLAWWLLNGIHEVDVYLPARVAPDALLAFAALTGWLAAEVHRRRPAGALAVTALAALVVAAPLALWQSAAHGQPFAGYGLWAWLAFAALGVRSLLCLRDSGHRVAPAAQFAWWLVWALAASLLLDWLWGRIGQLGDGWRQALVALPWLLLATLALYRWRWLSMPLGARFDGWRERLLTVVFAVVGLWWCAALFRAGAAGPLPWVPLLNPMELAQLAALVLAVRWRLANTRMLPPPLGILFALLGFAWLTALVLRAVHHWGGLAWSDGLLSTSLAQTSLTVAWSVLGMLGWVVGSRRGQRTLWLAGAVLMGVVLLKLVVVDRQHLGNLLGIGSFIAYGLLCTVVGYLAPAPPKRGDAETVEQPA